MQTRQLIEASADVITITRLKTGDVYKRLNAGAYNSPNDLRYGVVVDVLNNGEDGAIVALELTTGYNSVVVEQKVFTAGESVALFAAQPLEVTKHSDEIIEAVERKVSAARKALDEALAAERTARAVVEIIERHELTSPERTVNPPQILESSVVDRSLGLEE